MIPKKIHYCWFGGNEFSPLVKKCIDSWKVHLPEYEIIEWNEKNFNIEINNFVKGAYEAKKYAFVSDYVRLYALYNYGGVYLDTDVEVKQNLDIFLTYEAFTGRESPDTCITGTMGAVPKHRWIKRLLDYYNNKSFDDIDAMKTNTTIITDITTQMYNIDIKREKEVFIGNDLNIYPFEYFCAKDYKNGKIHMSENTYTIHHFNGSWLTKKTKFKNKVGRFLRKYRFL